MNSLSLMIKEFIVLLPDVNLFSSPVYDMMWILTWNI